MTHAMTEVAPGAGERRRIRIGIDTGPVVAGVSSAIWTGERFSGAKVASAAVVLLGLGLARLGGRPARREPA